MNELNCATAVKDDNDVSYADDACDGKEHYPDTPAILANRGFLYTKLLGEGSTGKTYKAKIRETGEVVAIKALRFNSDLKNYELFDREASVLESIHVKGVPRFYKYIKPYDNFRECWLVQEYIKGRSILDCIESHYLFSERDTLIIMREVAVIINQLQTLYSPPVIHRDIKPSNIIGTGDIEVEFQVNLIDFGAVANPQKRGEGSTVAGTLGYMAPEQLIGDCTIQSDYYALGATALHMLTGIAPSDFPAQGFKIEFVDKLREIVPGISPSTIDLLTRLLSPNVDERPKNSETLLREIEQLLLKLYGPGEIVECDEPSIFVRLGFFGSLLKGLVALLFGILAVVSGIAIYMVLFYIEEKAFGSKAPAFIPVNLLFAIGIPVLIVMIGERLLDPQKYTKNKNNNLLPLWLFEQLIEKYSKYNRSVGLVNSSHTVSGVITNVYDDPDGMKYYGKWRGIYEFVFKVDDIAYTGLNSNLMKNYRVGDKVDVGYEKTGNRIKSRIIEHQN